MALPISIEKLYEVYLNSGQKICTDTRKLETDAMFFALKGSNFNANEFAQNAIEAGCSAAVVDDQKYVTNDKVLVVEDVLLTLQQLANFHRRQFKIPFLAITGSNGKTTNKELIKTVLSKKYNTLATIGNLNNHIGVPLTLLRVTEKHEFAIIEMGANHQGEIDALCKIAEPDYGLITNIGKAHLEGFGGIEGVKKGKSELYKFLKNSNAKAFINGDDEVLFELAFENDKITYGTKKLYDLIGKDCTNGDNVSFKMTTRYGDKDWNKHETIHTQIIGNYNFINCLASACVGNFFKVNDKQIKEALEQYVPDMNRSQLVKTKSNTIILDAYNANPNSMKVAIENFATYKAENKLLLLGDMYELGEYSIEEHQRIIDLLKEKKFKNVILVGEEFFKLSEGNPIAIGYKNFRTTLECKDYLQKAKVSENTVLIKGSRGMKMEILQEVL
ncbi:UDP-N-acetylmuramoyl-tripeptide--D-alanyl-D-alanine ligase [Aurantibacillus circumpalustris]|uniref:UDP-N-acetylmuramoyl-tripeptide--D-alanyl-D- alanine ligase n=1 Tax=Aurantibacillus circumpalustris TaxID=3036359 RepID=UPI00295B9F15|nr:UDP-N-acetylmuramoyl-tripeptide--D-alanyl-D-alanine ligase [Aurantibacillus circumpalustris]